MDLYNFHKTKYGPELLIDLIRLETLDKYITDNKPHVLSYYDITLITKGSGFFYIDEHRLKIKSQTIFFSSPMQVRKWEFEKVPQGLVLIFEEEFLGSFFNDAEFVQHLAYFNTFSQQPTLSLFSSDFSYFETLLKNTEREILTQQEKDNHILRALLYQALCWLNRLYIKSNLVPEPLSDKYTFEFRKLVNLHFKEQHSVNFYAEELNITAGHLNELVKHHLGISAKEFIQNRVFLEAKRLLLYSSLTVSEIAWKLNFQDDSYFVRAFKNKIGCTPNSFRNTSNP